MRQIILNSGIWLSERRSHVFNVFVRRHLYRHTYMYVCITSTNITVSITSAKPMQILFSNKMIIRVYLFNAWNDHWVRNVRLHWSACVHVRFNNLIVCFILFCNLEILLTPLNCFTSWSTTNFFFWCAFVY